MNKEKKLRLLALLGKSQDDLSGDEAKELLTLQKLAETHKFVPTEDEISSGKLATPTTEDPDDPEGLSEEEVKSLVKDSIGSAFGELGLDADTVKAIKESLDNASTVDGDAIQKAVKSAIGGNGDIDMDALAKKVKDGLPETVSEEKMKTLFEGFKKEIEESQRKSSRMSFPTGTDLPIEHRSGNMTVAQKQLLNMCMKNVSEEAIEKSGIERPKNLNDGITDDQLTQAKAAGAAQEKIARHKSVYGGKATLTSTAGSGAELINTDLSSDIMARLYLESQIAAQFVSSEVQMPTNPFKFPLTTTRPTFYRGSEGVQPNLSQPGTAELILNAQKLIGMSEYSYEAEEDAVIAILPWLQEQMAKGAAWSLEDAFLNGDDSGTHMDNDVTEAADHRKLFKGLRHYANSVQSLQTSFATGGVTYENIIGLKKTLGKYGIKPGDLMIIAGVNAYNDLLLLEETLTLDKVGPQARILTGEAPVIGGIPIVVSELMREDLNATGVFDGNTTTKGSLLMVHKPSYIVGVKRGFTVEVDVDKGRQMNQVISSFRRAFIPKETPSVTETSVGIGVNYDS